MSLECLRRESSLTWLCLKDFSISFLIYLMITFLVHLYQTTGKHAQPKAIGAEEEGYSKLGQRGVSQDSPVGPDGAEAYELEEQDLSADEDPIKIGTEDEVDWLHKNRPRENGVRL